jgi:PBP1b-binding outer membrane lipoprotein LpoB
LKKYIYTTIATLGLFIVSCSVVDQLLTFTISNQTTFKIPSGFPVGVPIDFVTPDITTNSSSEFENNNTKANLVKDVRLKDLTVTITDPANKTFSFLKSIRLYISTDANDEIELAYKDDINSTSNTLTLLPTDAKLDKYIKAPSFKLRTEAVTKEAISQDITVKADMKFRVTADPF